METFSALLAFCTGNSPVTGKFPVQRRVTQNFDIFFDLRLNQQLRNGNAGDLRRLRAHYDAIVIDIWSVAFWWHGVKVRPRNDCTLSRVNHYPNQCRHRSLKQDNLTWLQESGAQAICKLLPFLELPILNNKPCNQPTIVIFALYHSESQGYCFMSM